jgi:hypothetical protein
MKLLGRRVRRVRHKDQVTVKVRRDGTAGPCYFCGAAVVRGSDFAVFIVERINPEGDPIHAVCHGACAERAGSAPERR